MKKTKLLLLAILSLGSLEALWGQVNTNSINVPNSGASDATTPSNTNPFQNNNLANPSNSTTPGSSGSYTVDLSKPDLTVPSNTPYNGNQGTSTSTPQTKSATQQKKKEKK